MIENHPFFDTVTLEKDMDVALAARLAEVSEAEFRALNPSMHRPVILAAGSPQILLPWDNAAIFKRNLQYHIGPLASWTAWAVPSHMRTADIAKRFGMPETDLRSLNQIPPSMLVKAGSTLLVPRASEHQAEVPEHLADNGQVQFQPEVVRQRGSAKARKGETVTSLARRLNVEASDLMQWNRLSAGQVLKAGQNLVVYRDVVIGSGGRSASSRKVSASVGKPKVEKGKTTSHRRSVEPKTSRKQKK